MSRNESTVLENPQTTYDIELFSHGVGQACIVELGRDDERCRILFAQRKQEPEFVRPMLDLCRVSEANIVTALQWSDVEGEHVCALNRWSKYLMDKDK